MNSRIDVEIQVIQDELEELMNDANRNHARIKELKGDLEVLLLIQQAEEDWIKQNIFDRE